MIKNDASISQLRDAVNAYSSNLSQPFPSITKIDSFRPFENVEELSLATTLKLKDFFTTNFMSSSFEHLVEYLNSSFFNSYKHINPNYEKDVEHFLRFIDRGGDRFIKELPSVVRDRVRKTNAEIDSPQDHIWDVAFFVSKTLPIFSKGHVSIQRDNHFSSVLYDYAAALTRDAVRETLLYPVECSLSKADLTAMSNTLSTYDDTEQGGSLKTNGKFSIIGYNGIIGLKESTVLKIYDTLNPNGASIAVVTAVYGASYQLENVTFLFTTYDSMVEFFKGLSEESRKTAIDTVFKYSDAMCKVNFAFNTPESHRRDLNKLKLLAPSLSFNECLEKFSKS